MAVLSTLLTAFVKSVNCRRTCSLKPWCRIIATTEHRLIGITLPDGSDVTYRYDTFGRRIAKDMDGKTTQFLWQGDKKTNPRSRMHSS